MTHTTTTLRPDWRREMHVQQLLHALCEGQEGLGVLERIIAGPDTRYGFGGTRRGRAYLTW
jgi:hypothetical protein